MRKRLSIAFVFGFVQCLSYFLLAVNMRAVARGDYGLTVASDILIAGVGFFVIKRVAEAKGYAALVGYCVGGAIGSVLAIRFTS